jgi:uncharacterized protein involved in exopolysaccharide biosynthesis
MSELNPNTWPGLTGSEASPAARRPNGEALAKELDLQPDGNELAARERAVAKLRLLWKERKFLGKVALGGLAAATLTAFLLPKRYEATARLMPPEQAGGSAAMMLSALAGKGSSIVPLSESALGMRTTGDLFVGILQSRTVQDRLVEKFDARKLYGARYLEDARRELADHTDISLDRKSGIITLKVSDSSAQRAAAMVAEYVSELNWIVNNLSTSSAHRERMFLEERLQQVKADLQGAEEQFSAFASKKGTIDIQAQGKAMVEAAAALQGQLIAAQSELEALRQIYTGNNVRVRAVEARVAELRRQLRNIGGTRANENSAAEELYPSIRELPLLGVSYADLLRRVKVQEVVFETLTQEYELAKVQEARETPVVKELDPPRVPEKKSFPPRLLIIALGTLLALFVGGSGVLSRAAWEATDANDPRKALATEVWSDVRGVLPWAAHNGSRPASANGWWNKFRWPWNAPAPASEEKREAEAQE